MTDLAAYRRLLTEVDHAGGCVHPVLLSGTTVDHRTGELWEGAVPVACKDRRAAVCPACAARYRADAWHLAAAGLRGGKGVPATVAVHPALFVTVTAPSFGPVHAQPAKGPCRPRRAEPVCPHGVPLACRKVHAVDDPDLGQPLCPDCFDYQEAVLWNAHVGRLWNRTTVVLRRGLARAGGLSERTAARHFRLSYVKVAEFQRRGLVHLHAVVRADGADGPTTSPPAWLDVDTLAGVVREVAATASVARCGSGQRLAWGSQLDVAMIGGTGDGDATTVAGYVAKYAVKGSEPTGVLARRLRSADDLAVRLLPAHHARLVRTAWDLGRTPALRPLRLRDHAHTFGYPGHFATKSLRYSTTFGALRQARATYRSGERTVEGVWRFSGRGYPDPKAAVLADALAGARTGRRRVPRGVPAPSPTRPHLLDQG